MKSFIFALLTLASSSSFALQNCETIAQASALTMAQISGMEDAIMSRPSFVENKVIEGQNVSVYEVSGLAENGWLNISYQVSLFKSEKGCAGIKNVLFLEGHY